MELRLRDERASEADADADACAGPRWCGSGAWACSASRLAGHLLYARAQRSASTRQAQHGREGGSEASERAAVVGRARREETDRQTEGGKAGKRASERGRNRRQTTWSVPYCRPSVQSRLEDWVPAKWRRIAHPDGAPSCGAALVRSGEFTRQLRMFCSPPPLSLPSLPFPIQPDARGQGQRRGQVNCPSLRLRTNRNTPAPHLRFTHARCPPQLACACISPSAVSADVEMGMDESCANGSAKSKLVPRSFLSLPVGLRSRIRRCDWARSRCLPCCSA